MVILFSLSNSLAMPYTYHMYNGCKKILLFGLGRVCVCGKTEEEKQRQRKF